jgi:hypothetical protein
MQYNVAYRDVKREVTDRFDVNSGFSVQPNSYTERIINYE